jgi:hypothetical protein
MKVYDISPPLDPKHRGLVLRLLAARLRAAEMQLCDDIARARFAKPDTKRRKAKA